MGHIGEYVHYYGTNYAKYGISRTGQGANSGFNFNQVQADIRNRAKNISNNGSSSKELENIRTLMNKILDPSIQESKVVETRNAITQKMTDKFENALGVLNYTTGRVFDPATAVIDEELRELLKKEHAILTKLNARGDSMRAETIASRLRGIELVINTIKSVSTRQEIQRQLNDVTNKFQEIYNLANQDLNIFNTNLNNLGIHMQLVDENVQNLITEVNCMLAAVRGTSIAEQTGDFGELLGTAINYLIDGNGIDNLSDALKTYGNEVKEVKINSDFFVNTFDASALNLADIDGDGDLIKLSYSGDSTKTKGKLDFEIHLNQDEIAKVSMKNYNLAALGGLYSISLVSDTPLLYLLQDEESNFINHYLNLVASHPGEWHSETMCSQLMAARMTVKLLVIWKAMTGLTYQNVSVSEGKPLDADTLIINDTGKTGIDSIHVYSMGELMNQLINMANTINSISALDSVVKVSSTGGNLDTIRFVNQYSSTVEERINTLLTSVYAQKISVGLKPAFIKNF